MKVCTSDVVVHDWKGVFVVSCNRDYGLQCFQWRSPCVRICGMRMAISSTWSGVLTAASCHAHRDCCHGFDHCSATMRDLHLSWDVVVGSCTVLVVCCGAWSVTYPQPPPGREHGCTVGIDRDPPVRCSHPGRMMRTPQHQLLRAWLVLEGRTAHVDTFVGRGVVV